MRLGAGVAPALSAACHAAGAGNPFLISELLEEFRRQERPAAEIDPAAVRGLASERVAAAILLRVGRLGRDAPALVRAVAVLGEGAMTARAAELAGLSPERALALAGALAEAAVLESAEPLRFRHPLVRASIYEEIGEGRAGRSARPRRPAPPIKSS